jgi:hypothetical protein
MNTTPITFTGIFQEPLDKAEVYIKSIEIPIIQRDYAQGRESKDVSRIRKQFINSLYNAITGKSEPIKLDFVYGNVTNSRLIPLDGQQRLTTLFLLHWYIAKHEKINETEYSFLKNFTYKTRFSSQHFCESLVACQPDFDCEKLSEWITNQNWFMYSWEKDPTINSMLVMLDEIHNWFKNETSLWQKLVDETNAPVSFYFLALEEMGLTDTLYIKMNSRGKPLTEFEHFKANFEKIIKVVSIDLYNEFVHKVDKDWLDMLWDYRNEDNIIDDEFMRYYHFITEMICHQNDIEILENDFDLAIKVFGIENPNAKSNLEFLFKSFDCWKEIGSINTFFESAFSKTEFEESKVCIHAEETNLFSLCCNDYGIVVGNRRNFSLNNTLLLFAVVQYLVNKEQITLEKFRVRIRIIRNLVLNSSFEIRETRLQGLLNDTQNIIVNGHINTKSMGYNELQKLEEIDKIEWRKFNGPLVNNLNKLEDHFLLQGTIAIVGLDYSEKLASRSDNFFELFNNTISYTKISKALLTIDDYSQLASWRFLFGNNNASSWRELFARSNQRKRFEVTQATLLQLLDGINGEVESYLQMLIDTYLNDTKTLKDWKFYFIKYPEMRQGNSGVYWWRSDKDHIKENPYEVFMMNTALSTNGKHWDPYLLVVSRFPEFKNVVTIEEYGASLVLNKTSEKINCRNDSWEILDTNSVFVKSIAIPQVNGIDTVDRIELLKNYLKTIISV